LVPVIKEADSDAKHGHDYIVLQVEHSHRTVI
jgi:hypothetical protein